MRTAVDTNVISALWAVDSVTGRIADSLSKARNEGGVVISPTVYAELLAHPKMEEESVNSFLDETGIAPDFDLSKSVWVEAGRRFARYAERRRRSGGGSARRLLADFVIGAHALVLADRLMTLDSKRYERDFSDLKLLNPL